MLKIYNTLTKQIEEFKPINDNIVTMYSCGPTVYSAPHIGNMRAYVLSDLIKRTLISIGYNVKNAINITDVGHLTSDADEGEDKLEKEAGKLKKSAYDIADEYSALFFKYLDELNINPATIYPKATDHIQEQIDMIKQLEDRGYTYKTSDGIYFDTSKFEDYKKFANIDEKGLQEGIRVDFNEKLNKTDFALWKFSPENKQREMEWDSPWGIGFPGWHIECSAMARKHLGSQIDIHTGGIDHIPVHHTNEIAQSEAITGKRYVNYWLHVNFLQLEKNNNSNDSKMSKSKGNVLTLDSIKQMGISPMTLKYYYLTSHYRSELKYSEKILRATNNTVLRLRNKIEELKDNLNYKYEDSSNLHKMKAALYNDLNTPTMIALLHSSLNDRTLTDNQKLSIVKYIDNVLGLDFADYKNEKDANEIPQEINKLADSRKIARNAKNWQLSDEIRNRIEKMGFKIKDKSNNEYEIIRIITKK